MLRSPLLGHIQARGKESRADEALADEGSFIPRLNVANLLLLWMGLLTAAGIIFTTAGILLSAFIGGRLLRR